MGHVMAQLLERSLGIHARVGLAGHESNHEALLRGEIDLYADYVGTGLRRYLGLTPVRGARATYRAVRDGARRRWDTHWLRPFGFNNTYAVILRAADARAWQVGRVSDLARRASEMRLGAAHTFLADDPTFRFAPGGYAGLRHAYGAALAFQQAIVIPREEGAPYDALADGRVDAIVDFPLNPRMVARDLVELRDDRRFFAPYHAAPVVRGAFLRAHPEAAAVLDRLAGQIDNPRAARLNHAVDLEARPAEQVAAEVLAALGLGHAATGEHVPISR